MKIKKLEKFLSNYKNTLGFFGIVVALLAFVYTAINTRLTYNALKFEYKTNEQKNTPIFDCSIIRTEDNIDYEYISFTPKNEDISLNSIRLFYTISEKHKTYDILVPEKYNLSILKSDFEKELKSFYCDNCYFYSELIYIPLVANLSYFQFGEQKHTLGLYKMTCKLFISGEKLKISIKNLELLKYYSNKQDSVCWSDIVDYSYLYGYKNFMKATYIESKKVELIRGSKILNSAIELVDLLSNYVEYNVKYEPEDSSVKYFFNYFLKYDSLRTKYINLLKDSDATYKKLKKNKTNSEVQYKNLILFLKKNELPKSKDLTTIINTTWINKKTIDSITFYRTLLKESLLGSIKYTP